MVAWGHKSFSPIQMHNFTPYHSCAWRFTADCFGCFFGFPWASLLMDFFFRADGLDFLTFTSHKGSSYFDVIFRFLGLLADFLVIVWKIGDNYKNYRH